VADALAEQTSEGTRRQLQPRRSPLPNGRALLGALLVTSAAIGTFWAANSGGGEPTTSFVVATRDIEPGETILSSDISLLPMDLPTELAALSAIELGAVDGGVALQSIDAGQLVYADAIGRVRSNVGEGTQAHEVALPVELARVPSDVDDGDRVTVVATTDASSVVAVEDALVISIDRDPQQTGRSTEGVLTLAIPSAGDVLALVHLAQTTETTVVRSTRALSDTFPESFPASISESDE